MLLSHFTLVQEYFARIGLEVRLNEEDGYASLHQPALEDDEGQAITLPRLTRRDRLTYHATLLCVLLREWIDQFERSEEHTSELQSRSDLVCRLLLEKKKKITR